MAKGNSSRSTENSSSATDILPVLIFGTILCYLMYGIAVKELPRELSDFNGHVYTYISTFTGESALRGFMMTPYFLWHLVTLFFRYVLLLPIENSAALSSCIFITGSFLATCYMIKRWNIHFKNSLSQTAIAFLSFALTIIQPIWISFLDAGSARTVGVFSFNPLYSPTHMAARPFAIICFMLTADLFAIFGDGNNFFFRRSRKQTLVLLSVFLLISAFAKPVFAECFIPAVGILILIKQVAAIRAGKGMNFFRSVLLPAFIAAIPCILLIVSQFVLFVFFGGSYDTVEGVVITPFLQVWSAFSENVPLSMLLMMSFPIYILVIDFRNYVKTTAGSIGLASFIAGFFECAFLGEGGVKLYHGNFIWPMLYGVMLLWFSALLHFLNMNKKTETTAKRILLCTGWVLFLIHVLYGFLYISEVLEWNFFIF